MDKVQDMAGGFNAADMQKYTEGVSWPVGKDDLVGVMKGNGAPDEMVEKVQGSDQTEFTGPDDVVSAARSQ